MLSSQILIDFNKRFVGQYSEEKTIRAWRHHKDVKKIKHIENNQAASQKPEGIQREQKGIWRQEIPRGFGPNQGDVKR